MCVILAIRCKFAATPVNWCSVRSQRKGYVRMPAGSQFALFGYNKAIWTWLRDGRDRSRGGVVWWCDFSSIDFHNMKAWSSGAPHITLFHNSQFSDWCNFVILSQHLSLSLSLSVKSLDDKNEQPSPKMFLWSLRKFAFFGWHCNINQPVFWNHYECGPHKNVVIIPTTGVAAVDMWTLLSLQPFCLLLSLSFEAH